MNNTPTAILPLPDAEMWVPVPFADVAALLCLFGPRGEGEVRDRLVRCDPPTVAVSDTGSTVSMVCAHPLHGMFRIALHDVEVADFDRVRRTPTVEDVDTLRFYTFEVFDSSDRIYGTSRPLSGRNSDGTVWVHPDRAELGGLLAAVEQEVAANRAVKLHSSHRSFLGQSSLDWFADAFTVERAVATHEPGACAGCGSTAFYMSCQVTFPVVADGPEGVALDPNVEDVSSLLDQVVLSKPFTKVTCRNCKLEKVTGMFGHFDGPVAGVAWNSSAPTRRLSDIYNYQAATRGTPGPV
jgi:hypothetical protein